MRYRIEFLDGANTVVRMMHIEAGSPANAFLLVVEKDWPPDAITARVVDEHGRRGLSVSKPQMKIGRRQRGPESDPDLRLSSVPGKAAPDR
jgi:hypothetical protein